MVENKYLTYDEICFLSNTSFFNLLINKLKFSML